MKKLLIMFILISGAIAEENLEQKAIKAFDDIKFSGFIFGRYTDNFGKDAKGYAQQWRGILNARSGEIDGFRLGAGIFFGIGSGVPDGANSWDDIQGPRSAALDRRSGDRFSVSQLYGEQEVSTQHFGDIYIRAGRMNISSPLNNSSLDMGSGVKLAGSKNNLSYELSVYDSWNTDYNFYILGGRGQIGDNGSRANAFGLGNIMSIFGLKYNGDIQTKLFYSHANKLYDYMIFGEIYKKFDINSETNIGLKAQIITAGLNKNPYIRSRNAGAYVINQEFKGLNPQLIHAKHRGIYNLNMAFSIKNISLKAGFLGSFMDGYGVSNDGESSLDVPGKIWLSGITAVYEGFYILGSGAKKDSSIYLPYLAFNLKATPKLNIGLDMVYLYGDNNMPLFTSKGIGTNPTIPRLWGTLPTNANKNAFKNIKVYEITPHITYHLNQKFKLSGYLGTWIKDVSLNRFRIEGRYTF